MKLSVIVPVYNSALFISETFQELVDYLEKLGEDYELLFVDDGSRDNTGSILEELAGPHPRVFLIRNGANRGKGYSVRAGMKQAQGDFLVFTDADLAYPPTEIGKIVHTLTRGGGSGHRHPGGAGLPFHHESRIFWLSVYPPCGESFL